MNKKLEQKLSVSGIPHSVRDEDDLIIITIDRNHLLFDELMGISKVVKIHSITAQDDKIELIILKC